MPAPAAGFAILVPETAAALVAAAKATLAVIGGALAVLAEKIDEQTRDESKDRPEDDICVRCEKKRKEAKKERKRREKEEKRERDEGRPASDRYAEHKKKELEGTLQNSLPSRLTAGKPGPVQR